MPSKMLLPGQPFFSRWEYFTFGGDVGLEGRRGARVTREGGAKPFGRSPTDRELPRPVGSLDQVIDIEPLVLANGPARGVQSLRVQPTRERLVGAACRSRACPAGGWPRRRRAPRRILGLALTTGVVAPSFREPEGEGWLRFLPRRPARHLRAPERRSAWREGRRSTWSTRPYLQHSRARDLPGRGYEAEERAGRVIWLAPGELRRYPLEIEVSAPP
jgi:hypothetical protein